MLLAFFGFASPWIKYKLFKTYCMPLYGSVLWDLSCTDIKSFILHGVNVLEEF